MPDANRIGRAAHRLTGEREDGIRDRRGNGGRPEPTDPAGLGVALDEMDLDRGISSKRNSG